MKNLTPSEAVKARESLKLSQAIVARETGLSRPYLSQFEGGKRVLGDRWLEALYEHYTSLGWEPDDSGKGTEDEDTLNFSPGCGLKMIDGFVVSEGAAEEFDLEALLEEYYKNSQEIAECRDKKLPRTWLFGLDEDEALKESLRMLGLTARQYQIKQMLHGQFENHSANVDPKKTDTIVTVGDFVEVLIMNTAPNRALPVNKNKPETEEAA